MVNLMIWKFDDVLMGFLPEESNH